MSPKKKVGVEVDKKDGKELWEKELKRQKDLMGKVEEVMDGWLPTKPLTKRQAYEHRRLMNGEWPTIETTYKPGANNRHEYGNT